jgi:hypothetical protein
VDSEVVVIMLSRQEEMPGIQTSTGHDHNELPQKEIPLTVQTKILSGTEDIEPFEMGLT